MLKPNLAPGWFQLASRPGRRAGRRGVGLGAEESVCDSVALLKRACVRYAPPRSAPSLYLWWRGPGTDAGLGVWAGGITCPSWLPQAPNGGTKSHLQYAACA